MRRAEMARRRKNLSEKRNEEEKVSSISSLHSPSSFPSLLSTPFPSSLLPLSTPTNLSPTVLQMDTINRLLKKQAPKRRGKISGAELQSADPADPTSTTAAQEPEVEKPNPVFTRWISNAQGIRLGVPSEWEGTGAGKVFEGGGGKGWVGRFVEEV